MHFTIPYGSSTLTANAAWAVNLGTLTVADGPGLSNLPDALQSGLAHPIGGRPLHEGLDAKDTVLIVVSDSFRKTGIHLVLPTLVDFLNEHGIDDQQISFLFATGTHRPPDVEEQIEILGPSIYDRFAERAYAHDPHDEAQLVYQGRTRRGTPVFINRRACDADVVIATGSVVLHYFGGFGGGRKSIVPGIAGVKTIAANHSLNLDPAENRLNPDVAIGRLVGNPVAEDMLEGALLCPVDFLINTVQNRAGEIAGLYCGDLEAAHEEACRFAAAQFTVPITEKADFVVASAGSAKNFIQSHKSLYNAYQVVKPGGVVILATPAPEGYGGNKFMDWLNLGSADAIIAELRKHAEINGQTALSTLEKAKNALFITEMADADVAALGAQRFASLEAALETTRQRLTSRGIRRPTCYIMPDASFSVPTFSER